MQITHFNMLLFLFLFGPALAAVSPPDSPVAAVSPSDDHRVVLQRAGCPMFWYRFSGRCYKYIATRLTWADAELHCVSEGANLVSIHSLDEQNFVKSLIKNFDPAEGFTWIGLSDTQKEGAWMWSDGSVVNFTFWNPGEPNNSGGENCVHYNQGTQLKWNDRPCSVTLTFVCASRTVCP